jgi:hypothetical protein
MTSPEPSSFLGECCEALYTRRRFLKGALAGGALLAGASSVTPGAAATSPRRGSTGRRGSKDPYTSLVPVVFCMGSSPRRAVTRLGVSSSQLFRLGYVGLDF